ncbi:MAG: type II toxin-antitoxin system Phd/YefM family antitoxin [Roseiflexaceae bacterium]
MTKSFSTADIKARLSEMIGKVVYGHERLVVLRRGKPVAAIVSLQDLRRLEALDASGTEKTDAHPIMRAFGGWAKRDDLDTLIDEIYQNRAATLGREVEL